MALISVNRLEVGKVGVTPGIVLVYSTDSLSTVTTAGYLNAQNLAGTVINPGDLVGVYYNNDSAWFNASISSAGVITLQSLAPIVTLPTIANHIAVFTDVNGTIGEDATTAINGGNIQAGLSGTAGYLASFPATAARGSLRLVGANSAGNTVTQITNASQAAARIYTIPDGGQAASNFLLTDNAGTQTIATGSLALTLGSLTVAAGNIAATLGSVAAGTTVTGGTGVVATTGNVAASAGNVVAGASGAAGTFISFPATAANGSLILAAVNAGGAFNTSISNGTMGQSSVYTIPDVVNAVGRFLVGATATPFVSGEFPVASGTDGLMVSSGLAASNIQNKTNIIANSTADIGGAGAGPISVVVAGLTAASKIVATIASSSNAVAVAKCIATATGFDITFTGDPGAACVVNYVAFIAAQ